MSVGVGILGGGTVGGAVARRLIEDHEAIARKTGLDLEVRRIAVRDLTKERLFTAPEGILTNDPFALVEDEAVQLVVELMGGLEPAGELVLAALRSGKSVVTANKELVSTRGLELIEAAESAGVALLFEAAVGGGIPIIRPLSQSLAGERISRLLGIVNGTTNFILTHMSEEGQDYESVLAEAQRLGYAEADSTADVSGADAAAKAAILASLAFGTWVSVDDVFREGIEGLHSADIEHAARLGYTLKLMATAEELEEGVAVHVHPTLIDSHHPLASVRGAQNAVYIEGPELGEVMFSGPGAGGEPTATAVLGDIIDAARELLAGAEVAPPVRFAPGRIVDFSEVETRLYLRLEVADEPGVLAAIAGVFADNRVSIASVWQEGRGDAATLLLVTHRAREADLRTSVAGLDELSVVTQVAATLRVHGDGQ